MSGRNLIISYIINLCNVDLLLANSRIFEFYIYIFFLLNCNQKCNSAHFGLCNQVTFSFFFQVKVKKWINGDEKEPFFGLNAAFGPVLPEELKQAQRLPANFLQPATACSPSSSKVLSSMHLLLPLVLS